MKYLVIWVLSLQSVFADEIDVVDSNSLLEFLSGASNSVLYDKVKPNYEIVFPRDHLSHKGFKSEWWYVTGNFTDDNKRQYGIQWTLFRTDLEVANKLQTLYFAHAAVSTQNKFLFAERFAREDMGHAGVNAKPWKAFIDSWGFQGSGAEPLPGQITADDSQFSFLLDLSNSPYVLQGENGFSIKSIDKSVASYYYSAPFIKAKGHIRIGTEQFSVEGDAWFDREWSSSLLKQGTSGWDWMALHLNEDQSIMIFRLRGEGQNYQYTILMNKTGENLYFQPTDVDWFPIKSEEINGVNYPTRWRLKIANSGIDLIIFPLNKNQQIKSKVGSYWEGAIFTEGSHNAKGYIEMTGY